jgi:hypothetical protein
MKVNAIHRRTLLDPAGEKFHLNEAGHAIWTKAIRVALIQNHESA